MKDWELTGEAFDLFLLWLDADREQAAEKYEAIRRRLIVFFDCRGCADSENLADQTINRVIRQTPELQQSYTGDPAHRLYGVAHYIHLEYLNQRAKTDGGTIPEETVDHYDATQTEEIERINQCLERCLQSLKPAEQSLVLQYYQQDKQAKIDHRKWLANQLGLAPGTLRTRMNRLRQQLQDCITACAGIKDVTFRTGRSL